MIHDCCDIRSAGAAGLAKGFERLRNISRVQINSRSLGDAGTKMLSRALAPRMYALRLLDFSGCHMGDVGAAAIATAFQNSGPPDEVRLADNRIGDVGALALAEMLPCAVYDKTPYGGCCRCSVDLVGNPITNAGVDRVCGVLHRDWLFTDYAFKVSEDFGVSEGIRIEVRVGS